MTSVSQKRATWTCNYISSSGTWICSKMNFSQILPLLVRLSLQSDGFDDQWMDGSIFYILHLRADWVKPRWPPVRPSEGECQSDVKTGEYVWGYLHFSLVWKQVNPRIHRKRCFFLIYQCKLLPITNPPWKKCILRDVIFYHRRWHFKMTFKQNI